jgi:hypothetical protein
MIFSTDLFIILGIWLVGTLYTFYFGKGRGVTLILSLYPGLLLFEKFPYIKQLSVLKGEPLASINTIAIFCLCVFVSHLILHKYIFADFGEGKFIKSALVGLAFTGCILALWYFILPLDTFYNFSGTIDKWFSKDIGIFWWLLGPFGILFFV